MRAGPFGGEGGERGAEGERVDKMNETLRVPAAHSREGRGLYRCAKRRGSAMPHRGWPGRAKPDAAVHRQPFYGSKREPFSTVV